MNILLADDDADDCLFFKEALRGSTLTSHLTTVPDGEHLMHLLKNETQTLPDVLFLDLNMPRKNGFECLSEIKSTSRLKLLPVIVFSTSFEKEVVNQLFQNGAQYFIRKPSEFSQFKRIIIQTLLIMAEENTPPSTRENFVITLQTA
jgi:CheY-like chemotaxis protein